MTEGKQIFGIDVHTDFQPFVDWEKLKADVDWDFRFAIVKTSEGYGYKTRRYQEYIDAIKAAGLYTGSYHYFYATDGDTKDEALRQARYYVELAGNTDLPLILDLEDKWNITFGYVTAAQVADGALWCLDEIERLSGRTPMLYTGDWYMDIIPRDEAFTRFPLWVASYQYPDKVFPGFIPVMPDEWRINSIDWAIHQFSTKYNNPEVAMAGYEWPKGSEEWHRSWVAVNCDINRTTEAKLSKLVGETIVTPGPIITDPGMTPQELADLFSVERQLGYAEALEDSVEAINLLA